MITFADRNRTSRADMIKSLHIILFVLSDRQSYLFYSTFQSELSLTLHPPEEMLLLEQYFTAHCRMRPGL
jgi:hypothetical protein